MATHNENSRVGFENTIKGIYTENKWTQRGAKFERQVSAGMHSKISDLLDPLDKQVWAEQKYLETKDYKIRISGKADAYDKKNQILYDTKRVDYYFPGKYSEDKTIQHLLYFYLFPEAKEFVYLVAYGKDDKVDGYEELRIKRPNNNVLEKKVKEQIVEFINYLKYKGLWKYYIKHQKAKN
jgi:hypothetical protein